MQNYKIIAALADLHFGIRRIRADSMKQQLKDHFFSPLEKLRVLDGIFIMGDVTHTIITLNSDHSRLFHWFMNKVYRLARKKRATVIVVKGTISHDNDQLHNLMSGYVDNDDGVDFRVYDNPQSIRVWDDYSVLILPDVRLKSMKIVNDLLDAGPYDMILGHGLIDAMRFTVQESENTPMNPAVYPLQKLMMASRGPVLFGHIHKFTTYGSNFFYLGPFTVLERGAAEDAGFSLIGIADDDRSKFILERHINPDSAAYMEIELNPEILGEWDAGEIIVVIDSIIADGKPNDLYTIRIYRDHDTDFADSVSIIENRYRGNPQISVVKKTKTGDPIEAQDAHKAQIEKYAYCMDPHMPIPQIMHTYYLSEVRDQLPESLQAISEDLFWQKLDLTKEEIQYGDTAACNEKY